MTQTKGSHLYQGCSHHGLENRDVDDSDPHMLQAKCRVCGSSYSSQTKAGAQHELDNRFRGDEVVSFIRKALSGELSLIKRWDIAWVDASIDIPYSLGGMEFKVWHTYGEFEGVSYARIEKDGEVDRWGDEEHWFKCKEVPEDLLTDDEFCKFEEMLASAPYEAREW